MTTRSDVLSFSPPNRSHPPAWNRRFVRPFSCACKIRLWSRSGQGQHKTSVRHVFLEVLPEPRWNFPQRSDRRPPSVIHAITCGHVEGSLRPACSGERTRGLGSNDGLGQQRSDRCDRDDGALAHVCLLFLRPRNGATLSIDREINWLMESPNAITPDQGCPRGPFFSHAPCPECLRRSIRPVFALLSTSVHSDGPASSIRAPGLADATHRYRHAGPRLPVTLRRAAPRQPEQSGGQFCRPGRSAVRERQAPRSALGVRKAAH